MFRVTIFVAVSLATAIWAGEIKEEDFKKSCGKLMHGGFAHCCKLDIPKLHPHHEPKDETLKECLQLPSKSPSCERELCIATKKGFASADGTIIKSKLTEMIEEDFKGFPEGFITGIKEKCINGDIAGLGAADECEVMKFGKCLQLQMISNCPSWDDEGACQGSKDAVIDCVNLFQ